MLTPMTRKPAQRLCRFHSTRTPSAVEGSSACNKAQRTLTSPTRHVAHKVHLASLLHTHIFDLSILNAKVDALLDRFWRDLTLRRALIGFFD